MIDGLAVLGMIILLPLVLLDGVFAVETLAGLRRVRRDMPMVSTPTIAVLIPAHNESANLAAHLQRLVILLPAAARVVLVADNCSDSTAAIARAAGLDVVERNDPARKGKGYALDFGRQYLAAAPPEVVIVIDADCLPEARAVTRLALRAVDTGRAVQAAYLFRPAPAADPMVQVSNFAIAVKNRVRQRGGQRIGAAAVLTGSGMAFTWAVFAHLPLATGEVVEDLALGLHLVRYGTAPVYEDEAVIWSDASSDDGTRAQRVRWEGGFLAIARRHAVPLLAESLQAMSWTRLWLALHLLTPPLTLLLAFNGIVTATLALLYTLGMPVIFPIFSAACLVVVSLAVAGSWYAVGRGQLSLNALARLPAYLLWKLRMHGRLLSGRQTVAWTRTDRVDLPHDDRL